ncbi:MAG: ABC transporter permease [Chloroflexi bacterium]|nr:ABC transporter permease [Bacteroidota bacterium]MCL5109860.1 ABC transporter permease [Chloroflexota bacterium]
MVFKNLWRRKTRTLLTMLGIAVGVAAVVALSAFGEGMAGGFEKVFSSTGADLTVSQKDAMMTLLSSLDESVGDEIRQVAGVSEVTGTVVGVLQMPDAPYFIVKGEESRGSMMARYRILEGASLTGKKQILLGKLAAKNFKKVSGETFKINEVSYRIVGIYETGVAMEDGGAVMPLADAQSAFDKRDQVSYFNVNVKDPRRLDEIKAEIQSRVKNVLASRSGEATQQTETYDLYRSFGWFLGIFAVLVGGLGMMNTMLMSVLERTHEIGVLRALGWRRRRVVGLILGEGLVLALAGGALGLLVGVGLTEATALSPAVASLLEGAFTPTIFVQAFVISLFLGLAGALYPAWRASQLAPVEAMRHESGAVGNLGPRTRALVRLAPTASLRNLLRRPTRTLVTVAGIGIGVGFVVALLAMVDGFTLAFTSLLTAGQADLMAEQAKASDLSLSTIDERLADRLRLRPEVRGVSRVLIGVTNAPDVQFLMVFGLDSKEDYLKHYRVREGRTLERPREALLGRGAASGLKKSVGDTVRVGGSSFTVVGIYENGQAYEDASVAIPLKDAQQLFGKPRQVSLLTIGLHDPGRAGEIAAALEAAFPEVVVSKASEATSRMNDFATTYAVLNALIGLIVVVGGIVMTNAMLMTVFERTQEIGVLRALGWRRRRVLAMILAESLALSLLSGLAGIGIGVGLNYLLMLAPGYGQYLAPAFTPDLFLKVLALALALGAIGGIYPAWRATGLRPIEALRYE